MSVAYQSWEVTSGPTVGFNMAIQNNSDMCSMPDTLPPDSSSYNGSTLGTLSSSESFLKSIVGNSADMSNGLMFPSSKLLMPQDSVTSGFSSLSLHSSQSFEASASKNVDSNWLPTNETTILKYASHSAEYQTQGRASGILAHVGLEKNCQSFSPWFTTLPKGSCIAIATSPDGAYLHNSKTKLDVVVEEKLLQDDSSPRVCNNVSDDDLEVDSISSSSTCSASSLHDMPVDGHSSSGSSSNGDVEAQSEYRGLCSSSLGTLSPKKGLSRFYSGKSRSFSCLADVVSIKELSKPENPYAKKRKCVVGRSSNGRPQLPPLQKGVSSISKKLPNNGKSTLALAVAMSASNDGMDLTCEKDFQIYPGFGSVLDIPLASRSYSFSDLQGAAGSRENLQR